jgi:hypothetical protein
MLHQDHLRGAHADDAKHRCWSQTGSGRNFPLLPTGNSNNDPAAAADMKLSISGQRQSSKDACRWTGIF